MSFFLIPLTALIASILTFFSGFGLGTILLPVFAIYYPMPIAILLTASVHFSNNIFKIGLVFKSINWTLVLKFGLPSMLAAVVGAYLLKHMFNNPILILSYSISSQSYSITLFNLIIGLLIIIFSLIEVIPILKNRSFKSNKLMLGGVISGFFGGLSGHQGALRSAFLVRLDLPKEMFIATGTAIACLVDVSRMSIYAFTLDFSNAITHSTILIISVGFAIIGVCIGNKLLKKITVSFLKWTVTTFMLIIGLLITLGVII
jgi:uncharacterized membrane protein YfcA